MSGSSTTFHPNSCSFTLAITIIVSRIAGCTPLSLLQKESCSLLFQLRFWLDFQLSYFASHRNQNHRHDREETSFFMKWYLKRENLSQKSPASVSGITLFSACDYQSQSRQRQEIWMILVASFYSFEQVHSHAVWCSNFLPQPSLAVNEVNCWFTCALLLERASQSLSQWEACFTHRVIVTSVICLFSLFSHSGTLLSLLGRSLSSFCIHSLIFSHSPTECRMLPKNVMFDH